MNPLAEAYPDDEAAIFAALARMAESRFATGDADEVVRVAAPLEALYQKHPRPPASA